MTQRFTAGIAALALIGVAAALGGCGQKGDLFLPGENPNPPTPLLDDDDNAAPGQSNSTKEPADTAADARDDRSAEPAANEP
tara:strand:+ start:183 stop:428 length:246 start_codon:yes stop_codon:yes gene_type:complete